MKCQICSVYDGSILWSFSIIRDYIMTIWRYNIKWKFQQMSDYSSKQSWWNIDTKGCIYHRRSYVQYMWSDYITKERQKTTNHCGSSEVLPCSTKLLYHSLNVYSTTCNDLIVITFLVKLHEQQNLAIWYIFQCLPQFSVVPYSKVPLLFLHIQVSSDRHK